MTARERAQRWHERRVRDNPGHEKYGSCWCCCMSCDRDGDDPSPHWEAAQAAWRSG